MPQPAKPRQPTIRINAAAKEKLDRMQEQTELSQPALMDRAIDLLERQLLSEHLEADFAGVAEDKAASHAYQVAIRDFDNATSDGLPQE